MSRYAKDSAEAIDFRALFNRLKLLCDEPENVLDDARSDAAVRDVCTRLWFSKFFIESEDKRHREYFTNVDPAFLSAWREYEAHWDRLVSHAADILGGPLDDELPAPVTLDRDWEFADSEGEEKAKLIEGLIQFADDEANVDGRWDELQEGFLQRFYEAQVE